MAMIGPIRKLSGEREANAGQHAIARTWHRGDDDQSWVTEMTLNAPDIPAPNTAVVAFGVWCSLLTKTSAAGSYQTNQLVVPYIPIELLVTYDGGPDNGLLDRSNFTVRT
jgi:hypothetical protein